MTKVWGMWELCIEAGTYRRAHAYMYVCMYNVDPTQTILGCMYA